VSAVPVAFANVAVIDLPSVKDSAAVPLDAAADVAVSYGVVALARPTVSEIPDESPEATKLLEPDTTKPLNPVVFANDCSTPSVLELETTIVSNPVIVAPVVLLEAPGAIRRMSDEPAPPRTVSPDASRPASKLTSTVPRTAEASKLLNVETFPRAGLIEVGIVKELREFPPDTVNPTEGLTDPFAVDVRPATLLACTAIEFGIATEKFSTLVAFARLKVVAVRLPLVGVATVKFS